MRGISGRGAEGKAHWRILRQDLDGRKIAKTQLERKRRSPSVFELTSGRLSMRKKEEFGGYHLPRRPICAKAHSFSVKKKIPRPLGDREPQGRGRPDGNSGGAQWHPTEGAGIPSPKKESSSIGSE